MDRRTEKSRQAIMDALIKLMSEMDFEKITINRIADTANVNRSTVYLHFTDKYDLLDQCIDTYIGKLLLSCASDEHMDHLTSKSALLQTFIYLEQNASVYSTILKNRGIPTFTNRLFKKAQQSLSRQFDLIDRENNLNREIATQFLASAVVSSFEWWITNSMPYPAAVMAEQIWILLKRINTDPQA